LTWKLGLAQAASSHSNFGVLNGLCEYLTLLNRLVLGKADSGFQCWSGFHRLSL